MSFAPRKDREESKNVQKLRAEFNEKASKVAAGGFTDNLVRDKALAEKRKAHEKMVAEISGERKESKEALQKVLIQQGSLKTKEQHARDIEAAKVRAAQAQNQR